MQEADQRGASRTTLKIGDELCNAFALVKLLVSVKSHLNGNCTLARRTSLWATPVTPILPLPRGIYSKAQENDLTLISRPSISVRQRKKTLAHPAFICSLFDGIVN